MRRLPFEACLYAVLVIGMCPGCWAAASAQETPQTAARLAAPVSSFKVERMTVIDAVMRLGQQEHIPLGIEYANPDDLRKVITVDLRRTTIGQALSAVLPKGKGYIVRVRDGVVNISNKAVPEGRRNILNQVLPEFVVPESRPAVTVVMAAALLRLQLEHELRPQRPPRRSKPYGVAGSLPVGRMENQVGPLTLRKVTVRQVLNRLVSEHDNAAWIVVVAPEELRRLPPRQFSLNTGDLWIIGEYDIRPTRWSDSVLGLLRGSWPKPSRHKPDSRE
jgi:hypothetical protein